MCLEDTNDPMQTRVQQGDPVAPGSSVGLQKAIELVELIGKVMLAILKEAKYRF